MTVEIDSALDEPMVRFVFRGMLDRETIAEAVAGALDRLDSLGAYYAVLDIRELDASLTDFRTAFAPVSGGLALLDEPRIAPLLVTSPLPDDSEQAAFETVDAAITFARQRYAARQPGGPLL